MSQQTSKTKRATIRTVAEDAGVSVSAVSKVLRNAYGVSAQLREKVEISMRRLDYRPSISARGMRGKSYTMGVLMTDMTNGFFADIIEGITETAHENSYQALIGLSQYQRSNEANLINSMIDRQMDGVIAIGPQLLPESVVHVEPEQMRLGFAASRIPTVVIGHYDDDTTFDTVNCDDVLGARLAVNHLIDEGYERIIYFAPTVSGPVPVTVAKQRQIGYEMAMRERGMGDAIDIYASARLDRGDHETIRKSMRDLLSPKNRPDAIFCWSDLVAFDVLSALLSLGYNVPEDIGIVGFDDSKNCGLYQNNLTSVNQNGLKLGQISAQLLIDRINGRKSVERYAQTPTLSIRNSSRRRSLQKD